MKKFIAFATVMLISVVSTFADGSPVGCSHALQYSSLTLHQKTFFENFGDWAMSNPLYGFGFSLVVVLVCSIFLASIFKAIDTALAKKVRAVINFKSYL